MTIINIEDLEHLSNESSLVEETPLETRDSLKDSPYSDGTIDSLSKLVAIRDRLKDRGTICRADVVDLGEVAAENSVIQNHIRRYPSNFYSESLSPILYNETMVSVENSVIKSMSDTLSTITRFIGNHGGSAIDYIKEVFDEDARTNASITKVNVLVNYINNTRGILESSAIARKVSSDLKYVDESLYDEYTSKWNGLKSAMSSSDKEMNWLSESIALPVIDAYPKTMDAATELIEGLSKAKSSADIDKLLKGYKKPDVNITRLKKWVSKHIQANKVVKTEGVMSEFQSLAMTVRSHIKSLQNNRTDKVPFKSKDTMSNMSSMEWVTTKVISEDILKRAEEVSKSQSDISNKMERLTRDLVMDESLGHTVLPLVLELLSTVRGFGALVDSIGIITLVKRELVNEQLKSLTKAVGSIHQIVKDRRQDLTVGEISSLNKLTKELKEAL